MVAVTVLLHRTGPIYFQTFKNWNHFLFTAAPQFKRKKKEKPLPCKENNFYPTSITMGLQCKQSNHGKNPPVNDIFFHSERPEIALEMLKYWWLNHLHGANVFCQFPKLTQNKAQSDKNIISRSGSFLYVSCTKTESKLKRPGTQLLVITVLSTLMYQMEGGCILRQGTQRLSDHESLWEEFSLVNFCLTSKGDYGSWDGDLLIRSLKKQKCWWSGDESSPAAVQRPEGTCTNRVKVREFKCWSFTSSFQ